MATAPFSALPADVLHPTGLLRLLLDTSLTGVLLLQPRYDAAGETIIDFACVSLNPAGQRQLRLPERPAESFLTLYPTAEAAGIFGFYRDAFLSGEVARRQNSYQYNGLDGYFVLVAQRYEQVLVVNFTDTNNQPRAAVEEALRTSQTREQQALAEAETQRQRLHTALMQMPANINLLTGSDQVVSLVNTGYAQLFPGRPLLGRPFREAVPELEGQGYFELLDHVYQTGEPVYQHEAGAWADFEGAGRLEQRYYNTSFQPIRNAQGQVAEVLNFAVDVTAQVVARQQVQVLNEELAASNEELRAANEEYLAANTALTEAQQELRALNQELEARVQERTRQLSEQQVLLRQILRNVPAGIATLSGPAHRYTFFNECYHTFSAERADLGLTVAEVYPEVANQGFLGLLDQVYATGEACTGIATPARLLDHATGRLVPHYVDFLYQPLFDEQQRVQGILAFILDVTDRVRAQQQADESQLRVQELNEELAATNEELRATNEELHASNTRLLRTNHDLDTFVYTASHDLKAPITNIEGILNALRDTLPPAVQQDSVVARLMGLLDHTVGRFRTTIHQLTDLTRLQQTYNEVAERLQLAPVVAGVLADLAPAIAAAAAQVHLNVPPDLYVSFAPASLRSVVYNLLSNAVKYHSPERPAQVWLQAEQQPGQVVLTVRDNGLGLTESQRGRLFGVFQRLHTHVEGTGVGLYMIKRLIENAGATITVTSAPAVGSTFTVRFPA